MADEPKPLFNPWQTVTAKTYGDGDYAWMLEPEHVPDQKALDKALAECGDTLFKFLMIELASSEDCDSDHEAQRRVRKAQEQLVALNYELVLHETRGPK